MTFLAQHLRCPLVAAALLAWTLALAGPAQAQGLNQQELDYLARRGAIVFISQTNYPPFEFIDDEGHRAGMCVELAHWMATTLGFKARFTDASFQQAQEAVLEGRADVITSLFHSPKRARVFGFSRRTFEVPASIFVAAERPDIRGIKDLAGKTIAMQAGDYAQEFLESQGISFHPAYTKDFAEATDLVAAGQADALIGDEQIVLYHIFSRHLTALVKKVGAPLYVGQNCMATKAGDPVLVGILNKGLDLAQSTGALEQINRKWLGVHYRAPESFWTRYWTYLLAAAGLLLLASLLIWLWNLQLRGQVRRRTADLARSEGTIKAILAASPVGIGLVDGEVMGWRNPAMDVMLGRTPGADQEIGLAGLFADPEQYRQAQEALQKALAVGGQPQMETRWRRLDGQVFHCLLRLAPLEPGGQGRGAIAMASDITSRKQAEKTLAESEAKYRALIETTDTGFVILDPEGRVLDANQEYVRLSGHQNLEQIRGRSVLEWTSPQDLERNGQEVGRCLRQGQVRNLEINYLVPGGGLLPLEINATVVRSGERPVILSICRDISARKQAEEAMRENQERLRLLSGNLPNVMFYQVLAPPGGSRRFTYVSGSVERLNEVGVEEVLADADLLYGQILPEYREQLVAREAQSLAGMSLFRMEVQAQLPSGRLRWFDITSSPRALEGGGVLWDGVEVDITERKQAELALRVSDEKHRLVLEESTDPIFSFGPDGTYLFVNQAFATPFGLKPAQIIGKRIWDIFPQEEADKRFAAVKAVFASGQTKVIEVRVPQPVEDLYFVTSVKPVKDEQGRVVTVICISKDITQRKQAEEALRESEERFRVISEESPLGISLLNQDGRYEYVNPAFVRMFGYTMDQIATGEDWFRLAFPDPVYRRQVQDTWIEDLGRFSPGEVRSRTFQVTCQDGSRKTILFRPVTIAQGRQFVIYEDVTQRLEALEALKESERRYRELFDSMSDLIYTQDMEGRFLTVNPALAKLFGYPLEHLLGRRAAEFMRPELREAFENEYLGKLRQDGHHFGLSLYFAKDGSRRYIEYHSSLVTPEGAQPYISGVGRDVTERINAEKQLRRLQEQLFQSQKIQALGVLAGGIAHDFNNVLQAISGYTQLMLAESQATPANRERLEHIEQSIARASGMIGHLMTLARKGQTRLERVDLNQEVRRTIKILEHTLPKMISIHGDLAPELAAVSADATQVEQILLNLATNAAQAMPQGGQLSFRTSNTSVGGPQGEDQSALVPRCLRAPGGERQRPGHGRGNPQPHLRALLHHQAPGAGHRPGALHGLRHRD